VPRSVLISSCVGENFHGSQSARSGGAFVGHNKWGVSDGVPGETREKITRLSRLHDLTCQKEHVEAETRDVVTF